MEDVVEMQVLARAAVVAGEVIQKLLLAYLLLLILHTLLLLELAELLATQRMWLVMAELLLFLGYLLLVEIAVLLYHITAVPVERVALVVAVAENGTMTMTVVLVVLMDRMVKLLVLVVAELEKDREVQLVNLGKVLEHFMLAVVAAQVTFFDKSYSLSRFPVLIPAFILALPLFDTAMVVAIRTCRRVPFWIGDHNHISHRFVRMGLSRRSAVALVHLMALTVALGALPVFWGDFKTGAVIVAQMFLLLIIITVIQLHLDERNRGGD